MSQRKSNKDLKKTGNYRPGLHGSFSMPIEIPAPPKSLSKESKELWKEITQLFFKAGILTEVDWILVSVLCDSIVMYRQAQKAIETEGLTIESTTNRGTATKSHPAIVVRRDCIQQISQIMRQFGLTPVARGQRPDGAVADDTQQELANFLEL